MRIVALALLFSAFLAACSTTPAEQAAQAQRDADYMVQVYGPACEKLGYTRNTDPWRNCILSMSTRDALRNYPYDPYGYGYRYW